MTPAVQNWIDDKQPRDEEERFLFQQFEYFLQKRHEESHSSPDESELKNRIRQAADDLNSMYQRVLYERSIVTPRLDEISNKLEEIIANKFDEGFKAIALFFSRHQEPPCPEPVSLPDPTLTNPEDDLSEDVHSVSPDVYTLDDDAILSLSADETEPNPVEREMV